MQYVGHQAGIETLRHRFPPACTHSHSFVTPSTTPGLPNVFGQCTKKLLFLPCSLRRIEHSLVWCKCIALRRAASRHNRGRSSHFFSRVHSQPLGRFSPSIFTAPSLFVTKHSTSDPKVESGHPHNPIPSLSVSNLSSLRFNIVYSRLS